MTATAEAIAVRRADSPAVEQERPDGFDVDAILAAVRGVAGVKDARLRTTPAGAHSLRLDLSAVPDTCPEGRATVERWEGQVDIRTRAEPGGPPPP